MARGVNKVILVGYCGADPEVRYLPAGTAVTTLNVATNEAWKDKQTGQPQERTEWHRVVFFNRLAEIAGEYLRKGSQAYVEGSLRTRPWKDQGGQTRYVTEVVVSDLQMLGGFPTQNNSWYNASQNNGRRSASQNGSRNNGGMGERSHSEASRPIDYSAQPNFKDFDDDIPF
mgnify:CR=1 FL=1